MFASLVFVLLTANASIRSVDPSQASDSLAVPIDVCDTATLNIQIGDAPAGQESFAIICQGGNPITATGVVRAASPGFNLDEHAIVSVSGSFYPIRATVKGTANGVEIADSLLFGEKIATVHSASGGETIALNASTVYASSSFAHHLVLVLARYDRRLGGVQRITFFPNVSATIEWAGRDRVVGLDQSALVPFDRFEVATTAGRMAIWVDSAGHIAMVRIPAAQYTAVRTQYSTFVKSLRDAWRAAQRAKVSAERPDYSAPSGSSLTAEEVRVPSSDETLAGSLLLPSPSALRQGRRPGVILISGSGQQERDGNLSMPGLEGYRPLRQIAETLAAAGAVVLRVDDRGAGGSGERRAAETVTAQIEMQDIEAQIRYLRGRKEVDPKRMFLIGHSEGAVLAIYVAAHDPKIAGVVLMSAFGMRGDSLMAAQLEAVIADNRTLGKDSQAALRNEQRVLFADARAGKQVQGQPPVAWLRSFLDLQPARVIQQVHSPILIIHGGKDRQVPVENASILQRASRARNDQVDMHIFPNLNHLLLVANTGSIAEYPSLRTTVVGSDVLDLIVRWIGTH
jgi:alpha-beta hydrolase superfamily lysophospholipase